MWPCGMRARGLCLLLLLLLGAARARGGAPGEELQALPALRGLRKGQEAYGEGLTLSGFSSGAFMVAQIMVAHSQTLTGGAAVLAGGPYYCSAGSLAVGTVQCMTWGDDAGGSGNDSTVDPDLQRIYASVDSFAARGWIDADPDTAFKGRPIFVYSGQWDTVVPGNVVQATRDFFDHYGADTSASEFDLNAEHSFPTVDYGVPCATLDTPYISQCDYDAAGVLLRAVYPNDDLAPPGEFKPENLRTFLQQPFVEGGDYATTSIGQTGYIYVPDRCQGNDSTSVQCRLHIDLHGCEQGNAYLNSTYASNTGLNAYAESNDLVVLYPSVAANFNLGNYYGCWDWWGYTGPDFAFKSGAQIRFVMAMIDALVG